MVGVWQVPHPSQLFWDLDVMHNDNRLRNMWFMVNMLDFEHHVSTKLKMGKIK
jgi:hypothetical protein